MNSDEAIENQAKSEKNLKPPKGEKKSAGKKTRKGKAKGIWYVEKFKKRPIVWTTSFSIAMGYALIHGYYMSIGFDPQYDIKAVTNMFFDSALTGMYVIFALQFCILIPALYIGTILRLKVGKNARPSTILVMQWFGNAFVNLFVMSVDLVLGFYGFIKGYQFLLILISSAIVFLSFQARKGTKLEAFTAWRQKNPDRWRSKYLWNFVTEVIPADAWKTILIGQLQLPTMLMMALFMTHISALDKQAANVNFIDMALPLVVMNLVSQAIGGFFVGTWFFKVKNQAYRHLALLAVILMPFFMTFSTGNPSLTSYVVVHNLKIGNFYASEVTVTKRGCDAISSKGVDACNLKIGENYKLCGAYFMNDIGNRLYLKLNVPNVTPNAKTSNKIIDVKLEPKDVVGLNYDMSLNRLTLDEINKFMNDVPSLCKVGSNPAGEVR